jgi:hypothetical protein
MSRNNFPPLLASFLEREDTASQDARRSTLNDGGRPRRIGGVVNGQKPTLDSGVNKTRLVIVAVRNVLRPLQQYALHVEHERYYLSADFYTAKDAIAMKLHHHHDQSGGCVPTSPNIWLSGVDRGPFGICA